MKRKHVILFILALIFTSSMCIINGNLESNTIKIKNYPLTSKAEYILINGNGNFSSYLGYGNKTHPYLIENLIIDLQGNETNGISIKNTDVYFVIDNCTISNAGLNGICFDNVTNGKITNNTLVNNSYFGIFLNDSPSNFIINNTARNDGTFELRLYWQSHNTTIINNTFYSGITMGDSENNSIHNNSFIKRGIRIYAGAYTNQNITLDNKLNGIPIFFGKDLNDSTISGIYSQIILVNCTYMNISNYNFTNDTGSITLIISHYNNLSSNNIDNAYSALYFGGSNNNSIFNNTFTLSDDAIVICGSSHYNNVFNNSINSTISCGIEVVASDFNQIFNNSLYYGQHLGIRLSLSCNNTAFNNTIIGFTDGIKLQQTSNFNEIVNNTVNATAVPITLSGSSYNNVSYNKLCGRLYCIMIFGNSYNNTIENNDCYCPSSDPNPSDDIEIPGFEFIFILVGLACIMTVHIINQYKPKEINLI